MPSQNLYLEVVLAPHSMYHVDGQDMTLEVPIAPWKSVLGAKAEVPSLGGMRTVVVVPSVQSGQKVLLKGRGIPGDSPGDQYAIMNIVMPPMKTDRV